MLIQMPDVMPKAVDLLQLLLLLLLLLLPLQLQQPLPRLLLLLLLLLLPRAIIRAMTTCNRQ